MPRKRRTALLAHRELSWDDVDVGQHLDFWSGWHPPRTELERSRSGWQSWEAYLSDWSVVRTEALPAWEKLRAEVLAHARAEVVRRRAELEGADNEPSRDLWSRLLADAEARLEELELEALPFAEVAYQRALAGEWDDGTDAGPDF